MNIVRCEYCGRGGYLSRNHETCSGCGAPLPVEQQRPALMYDPRVFNQQDSEIYELLARPGVNIPVNLPPRSWLRDFIYEGAMLGASLCGKPQF